jgi:hypothetical protein
MAPKIWMGGMEGAFRGAGIILSASYHCTRIELWAILYPPKLLSFKANGRQCGTVSL